MYRRNVRSKPEVRGEQTSRGLDHKDTARPVRRKGSLLRASSRYLHQYLR